MKIIMVLSNGDEVEADDRYIAHQTGGAWTRPSRNWNIDLVHVLEQNEGFFVIADRLSSADSPYERIIPVRNVTYIRTKGKNSNDS